MNESERQPSISPGLARVYLNATDPKLASNWDTRTICFTRKKLKSRGTSVKPALFRFSAELETLLKRLPTAGQLFPYLCTVRAGGPGD